MDSLTTHFYPIDGAAAHLLHALMSAKTEDAHAAASELATSEKNTTPILFQVLCLAWWLQVPDHPLQYARHAAFLAKDAHGLYTSLVNSPFVLPSLTIDVPKTPLPFQKAIKKRDLLSIYSHAEKMEEMALGTVGIPAQYLAAMKATVYKPLENRILLHACAALVAYKCALVPAEPWSTYPLGKAGRTFTIQNAALSTWGVKPVAALELRGDPTKLFPTQLFETEEHEIEFYETQFPDDIPDEWSDSEISKSHSSAPIEYTKNPWRAAFFDCF